MAERTGVADHRATGVAVVGGEQGGGSRGEGVRPPAGGQAVGEAAGGKIFRRESHVGEQAGEAVREGPRPDAEANGGVRASELREARAGAGGDATTAEIRLDTRPDPDAAGEVDARGQGSKGGGVDSLGEAATGGGTARTTGPA